MVNVALGRNAKIASWVCQIVAAAILGQTLFFKFSTAGESVYIFTRLGIEVQGDGGLLFGLALVTFLAEATVAILRRREDPGVGTLVLMRRAER